MRRITTLFLGICFAGAAHSATIVEDPNLYVDDDHQARTETYSWYRQVGDLKVNEPSVAIRLTRTQDRKPVDPMLSVRIFTEKGLRPECEKPVWVIDDAVLETEDAVSFKSQMPPPKEGVFNTLNSSLTLHAMRELVRADKVSFKLCDSSFVVSEAERKGLDMVLGLFDGKYQVPDHPPHD